MIIQLVDILINKSQMHNVFPEMGQNTILNQLQYKKFVMNITVPGSCQTRRKQQCRHTV